MRSVNGSGMKRAALLNDDSCFGKCSLSVSVPILSAYGVEAVALPTALLSTHTGGFEGYVVRDLTQEMEDFSAHWKKLGLKFDCIYTGFFTSVRQIEFAQRFIRDFADENTLVLVDPVLGDGGKLYGCFTPEFVPAMRALTELADVITPNRTEAALLAGLPLSADDAQLLAGLKSRAAVITSVECGSRIGYLCRMPDGDTMRVEKERVDIALHGAGDVFASSLCGELLSGCDLRSACINAAVFCDDCIHDTVQRMPAHWYGLAFEDELKRRRL